MSVKGITTARCRGITRPINISLYSLTVRIDIPLEIRLTMAIKIVDMTGANQSSLLLIKKNAATDTIGIMTKDIVANKSKPKKWGYANP